MLSSITINFSCFLFCFIFRESAAQLLAILLAVSEPKIFALQMETLVTAVTTANVNYEKISGGLLALGGTLGRRLMTSDARGSWLVEDLEVDRLSK